MSVVEIERQLAHGDKWVALQLLLEREGAEETLLTSNSSPQSCFCLHEGGLVLYDDRKVSEVEETAIGTPCKKDVQEFGSRQGTEDLAAPDTFSPFSPQLGPGEVLSESSSSKAGNHTDSQALAAVDEHRHRKVRESLSKFLFEKVVDGLCGNLDDIPKGLSISDVLYLGCTVQPRARPAAPTASTSASAASSRVCRHERDQSDESLKPVFEAFDANLLAVLERESQADNRTALSRTLGRTHGTQWLTLVKASTFKTTAMAPEEPAERYFVGVLDERVFAPIGRSLSEDKVKSLEECEEYLVTCTSAFNAYVSSLAQVLADNSVADASEGKEMTLSRARTFQKNLKNAINRNIDATWHAVLQSIRIQLRTRLEGLRKMVFKSPLSPGNLVSIEMKSSQATCRWSSERFSCDGIVHQTASSVFDFLARLWESRHATDLAVDYTIIETSMEVVRDVLTHIRELICTKIASNQPLDLRSFMVLTNSVSFLCRIAREMKEDIGGYDSLLVLDAFHLSNRSLAMVNSVSELEAWMSKRLCECMESYALKFFVCPLESKPCGEDWQSDKGPDEDLSPVLVGFFYFCESILGHARYVQMSTEMYTSIRKTLVEILCNKAAKVYNQIVPSESKMFRYLCDVAYLTRAAESIAADQNAYLGGKDSHGSTSSLTHWTMCKESLEVLHKHTASNCGPLDTSCLTTASLATEPDDGKSREEASSSSREAKGFVEQWHVIFNSSSSLLRAMDISKG